MITIAFEHLRTDAKYFKFKHRNVLDISSKYEPQHSFELCSCKKNIVLCDFLCGLCEDIYHLKLNYNLVS